MTQDGRQGGRAAGRQGGRVAGRQTGRPGPAPPTPRFSATHECGAWHTPVSLTGPRASGGGGGRGAASDPPAYRAAWRAGSHRERALLGAPPPRGPSCHSRPQDQPCLCIPTPQRQGQAAGLLCSSGHLAMTGKSRPRVEPEATGSSAWVPPPAPSPRAPQALPGRLPSGLPGSGESGSRYESSSSSCS